VRSKCGRHGEKRGGAWSSELVNPEKHTGTQRNKKDGFSSSFNPAGRSCGGAIGEGCMTLSTSCSGLPLLLPCVRASALGTVPTPHCKIRLEFLTVSLPRHKLQPQSFLHPANSGGGTPLGVLLAIFIFPACVDLFLCYQISFVHQRALPNVANFKLKTPQILN